MQPQNYFKNIVSLQKHRDCMELPSLLRFDVASHAASKLFQEHAQVFKHIGIVLSFLHFYALRLHPMQRQMYFKNMYSLFQPQGLHKAPVLSNLAAL